MKTLLAFLKTVIKGSCLLLLILAIANGCTKYKEYEAVFPAADDSLSKYGRVVIANDNPGDALHQMLENSLKAQLTKIQPGNVKPAKEIDQIKNEIGLFHYNPKLEAIPDNKVATLRFHIKAAESVQRERKLTPVTLRSCNYLAKTNPCRMAGFASLENGNQVITIVLSGSLSLKDNQGRQIIPDAPISFTVSDSGKIVESSDLLMYNAVNKIAYDYMKRIIPHHEPIKSKILSGGDSIAVKLIQNNALNLAINRLDRIVSKDSKPEAEDLYNLGLAYEVLNELSQALVFYEKAGDVDPGEEAISTALKRIRRVVHE